MVSPIKRESSEKLVDYRLPIEGQRVPKSVIKNKSSIFILELFPQL
jgi:hypothetical protein